MENQSLPLGLKDMFNFSMIEALLGRRSRRFFKGAEIPDGVFSFKSKHELMPLSEIEKLLVVAACGGNTTWHHMIYRGQNYAAIFLIMLVQLVAVCFRPQQFSYEPDILHGR